MIVQRVSRHSVLHQLTLRITAKRISLLNLMVFSHYPTPTPIKMGCMELCGGVHTAQRQISTQIPIGFCVNLSASVCLVSVSSSVNAPLPKQRRLTLMEERLYSAFHKTATGDFRDATDSYQSNWRTHLVLHNLSVLSPKSPVPELRFVYM